MAQHPARCQPDKPVYLVAGAEPLLVEEQVDEIRRRLRQAGFSEREVMHADGGFNWHQLLESTSMLSLFAEKRIIELRVPSGKLNKNGSSVLLDYLNNPPPDTALLIIAQKLESASKKSAWFKRCQTLGQVFELWPVEQAQLPSWLAERAARLGLQITQDAQQLLAERIEGNLLAAQQELEKLALLVSKDDQGNQLIDVDHILGSVTDHSRFDLFALTDAALAGQPHRCNHIIQVLAQEGTETTLVLWALAREVRTLLNLQQSLSSGHSPDEACRKLGIWGKRKGPMMRAAQRLNQRELYSVLEQLGATDKMIKGLAVGDAWLQLKDASFRLSGLNLFPNTRI